VIPHSLSQQTSFFGLRKNRIVPLSMVTSHLFLVTRALVVPPGGIRFAVIQNAIEKASFTSKLFSWGISTWAPSPSNINALPYFPSTHSGRFLSDPTFRWREASAATSPSPSSSSHPPLTELISNSARLCPAKINPKKLKATTAAIKIEIWTLIFFAAQCRVDSVGHNIVKIALVGLISHKVHLHAWANFCLEWRQ